MQDVGSEDRQSPSVPVVFNWHKGTLQPYSSLWLVMHRLALINQITNAELRCIAMSTSFSTGMHSLTENTNTISLDALAAAIGERTEALTFSTMQPYARWLQEYFLRTSVQYCPACLALGFHSVFHCLTLMKRCPLHGERLRQHCSCGAPISACVSAAIFRDAGTCTKCSRRFLDIRRARSPSMAEEDLSVFSEVRDWLVGLSERVSTMVTQDHRYESSNVMRVDSRAELATQALGLHYPSCLAPDSLPLHAETVFSIQSPWPTRESESSDYRACPLPVVFRAVDRHLRRHVLRGQRWTTRLAMHSDAQYIAEQIAYEPDALLAWTYLLWLMAIFRSRSLRAVRGRDARNAYQRGIHVPGCNAYTKTNWDQRTIEWLEYHAAETSLLDIWRQLHQAALVMSRQEDPHWGPDIATGEARFQWIGLRRSDGSAKFAAAQTIGARFGFAVRPPKPHQRPRPTEVPRKSDAALNGMSRRGLIRLSAGDWKAGLLTIPTKKQRPQLKVHRLLHVGDPLHFIVVCRGGVKGYFAARLVEYGLEGRGPDARVAVESLRAAVHQYARQYGTPWKWDLPSSVREGRLLPQPGGVLAIKGFSSST